MTNNDQSKTQSNNTEKYSMIPVGHRILVKPDEVPEEDTVKYGDLELAVPRTEDKRLRQIAVERGRIVAIGPDAWLAFRKVDDNGKQVNGQPWAAVGDYVWYSKNAGKFVRHPETEELFVVMNDEDISLVLQKNAQTVEEDNE